MNRRATDGSPRALSRFQDAFLRALLADAPVPADDPTIARLREQPGFAVYVNTALKGCVDALLANYPSVTRLVGAPWMRATAAIYVRLFPPSQPCLIDYGDGFAAFLAGFPPAAELPYLPGVARLDRLWIEAHLAADEPLLDPACIAALTPDELADTVLTPSAAARWAWFDRHPVFSIWRHNRAADPASPDLQCWFEPEWKDEGALLVRRGGSVGWTVLGRAECAFLDACAAGKGLGDCAAAALAADPGADLAAAMAKLLRAGAFGRLHRSTHPLESTT